MVCPLLTNRVSGKLVRPRFMIAQMDRERACRIGSADVFNHQRRSIRHEVQSIVNNYLRLSVPACIKVRRASMVAGARQPCVADSLTVTADRTGVMGRYEAYTNAGRPVIHLHGQRVSTSQAAVSLWGLSVNRHVDGRTADKRFANATYCEDECVERSLCHRV